MLRALEAPARQIVENAGVEGSVVVGKILENKSQTYGFDAQTEQYVDMLQRGIVDPAKVVRVALQDAASVAGLMITTEAMVAERPKPDASGDAGRRNGRHGRNGLLIVFPLDRGCDGRVGARHSEQIRRGGTFPPLLPVRCLHDE